MSERPSLVASSVPAAQGDLRRHNLSVVLRRILEAGPMSRATLSSSTGLGRATVSNLVDELIDGGLLEERGVVKFGRVGRPGKLVGLSEEGPCTIGIEIKVNYLRVCVIDLTGRVRFRKVQFGDNRQQSLAQVMQAAGALARRGLEAADATGLRPVCIGLASPGITDPVTGILRRSPNLGWNAVDLVRILEAHLPALTFPVAIDSGANLEALGELHLGAARRYRNFVLVSGEVGVGAGIVIDGSVYRGRGGAAGELGHVPVDPNGPTCGCGSRGCLERYLDQDAILQAAGVDSDGKRPGNVADRFAVLSERAETGDTKVLATLESVGRYLGVGLAILSDVLAPDAIVLSGIFAPLARWLIGPLRTAFERSLVVDAIPEIIASELGTDGAAIGAAMLGLLNVIERPDEVADRHGR